MAVAVGGADQRHEPGADAQRAACAEPRRARLLRRPGDDDGVAARVLVPLEPRPGIACAATATGGWRRCGARCRPARASGMPMSARRTSPHSVRPGSSRWPGFRRKKVTVRVACTTGPATVPVRAVQAARHVDGDDRPAAGVDGGHHVGRDALQRPRQAGAEQGVDDDVGIGHEGRRRAASMAAPQRVRHRGGVALQRIARRPAGPGAPGSPSRASSRAATKPSPPLLPGPQATATAAPGGPASSAAASATARPAFSISVSPGTPYFTASAIGAGHFSRRQHFVARQGISFQRGASGLSRIMLRCDRRANGVQPPPERRNLRQQPNP